MTNQVGFIEFRLSTISLVRWGETLVLRAGRRIQLGAIEPGRSAVIYSI
jgi:hypothetical protein